MNHKEFCIWLEGYMDGIETGSEAPWITTIRKKLKDANEPKDGPVKYPTDVRDYMINIEKGER